jgi:hypothetical protein
MPMNVAAGEAGEHERRVRYRLNKVEAMLWALALLLVAGLTWHTWLVVERWQPAGEPLLALPDFSAGLDGWEVRAEGGDARVEDGALVLEKPSGQGLVAVERTLPLPAHMRVLRLEATVRTRDVIPGPRPWYTATIVLVGELPGGRHDQSVPHRLVGLSGSTGPATYARTFLLAKDAVAGFLSIRLQRAAGLMEVSALRLQPVEERPAFQDLALLTLVGWVLFAAGAAARFLHTAPYRGPAAVFVALAGFGILFHTFPQMMATQLVNTLPGELGIVVADADAESRLLHLMGFAGLAYLLKLARPRDPLLLHLAVLLLLAVGSELIEVTVSDLGADDVVDALFNIVGVALGMALGQWARRRELRRRQEARERSRRLSPRRLARS